LLQPLQNFCVKQHIVSKSIFLRTEIKIAVTDCHILRLKCTKINFFWGSAPDPGEGACSAPPDPKLDFRGSTCKGQEGKGGEKRALLLREGKGRRGEGREWSYF